MKRLLLGVIFFLLVFRSYGQLTSCAQTLRLAQSTYEQGRLHEVPTLLQNCLANASEKDFSKANRVSAYKLLVLSYLYLEEPEKANEAMLNLLRTDHYFEINPSTDPAEFIALYRTFRTNPIYRVGLKTGVNLSNPHVSERVVAVNEASISYSPNVNFQFGAAFEIPLKSRLALAPELNFQLKSFVYDLDNNLGGDLENSTEGPEKQSWISLPILVQYALKPGSKLNPFVAAGASVDYLMASSISLSRVAVNAAASPQRSFDIERNPWNVSALVSGGIKYKIGGGLLVAEVRYAYGLMDMNDAESAYSNSILLFDYDYADSIFKVNSVSATVGYVINIFNPKKLTSTK
jgi:hypothetical protein